jgi:hypothetical protein
VPSLSFATEASEKMQMLAVGRIGAQVAGDVAIEAVRLFEWQHPVQTILAIVFVDAALRRPAIAISCMAAFLVWRIDAVMGYIRQLKTHRSGLEDAMTLKSHGDTLLQIGRYLRAKYASEIDFADYTIQRLEQLNAHARRLIAVGLLVTAPTGCAIGLLNILLLALLLKGTQLETFYLGVFSMLRIHLRAHEISNYARENGEYILPCGHLQCQGSITVLGLGMDEVLSRPNGLVLIVCKGGVVPMELLASVRDELLKDFAIHIGEWRALTNYPNISKGSAHNEHGTCRSWIWTRQYRADDRALVEALAILLRYGLVT